MGILLVSDDTRMTKVVNSFHSLPRNHWLFFLSAYFRDEFLSVGTGPCARIFKGESCPYFPSAPFVYPRGNLYPACCDAKGCFCECIYICSTKRHLQDRLQTALNSVNFVKCNSSINTYKEGNDWKKEQCQKSKGSPYHIDAKRKCAKKKRSAVCVRAGSCFKNRNTGENICRFCYR